MESQREWDSELLEIARDLLRDEGADFSSFDATFRASQTLFRRYYEHLRPRIGDGAFRSMLQLAHGKAMDRHPVLGRFIIKSDANPFLGEAVTSVEDLEDAEVCRGLTQLLAESLRIMRELGQDQDWDLVELWPGLKALDRQGVSLDPPAQASDPRPQGSQEGPGTPQAGPKGE